MEQMVVTLMLMGCAAYLLIHIVRVVIQVLVELFQALVKFTGTFLAVAIVVWILTRLAS